MCERFFSLGYSWPHTLRLCTVWYTIIIIYVFIGPSLLILAVAISFFLFVDFYLDVVGCVVSLVFLFHFKVDNMKSTHISNTDRKERVFIITRFTVTKFDWSV